jgi:hypothetical protein
VLHSFYLALELEGQPCVVQERRGRDGCMATAAVALQPALGQLGAYWQQHHL